MGTNTGTDETMGPPSGTITIRYEIGPEEPPSVALVTVLSELAGRDPTEIEPLFPNVDLEALDEILKSPDDEGPSTTSVRLGFGEYLVTIDGSAILAARDPDSTPAG